MELRNLELGWVEGVRCKNPELGQSHKIVDLLRDIVFLNICNNKCLTQKASDITANVFTNNFNDSNDL